MNRWWARIENKWYISGENYMGVYFISLDENEQGGKKRNN